MIDKLKALEIIDKRDFFNDRAGRELWSKKPIDIQNEDIKNAHEDYKLLKEYILGQPKVNEWIPIEERLPKEKGLYLVAYHPCYWDNVKEDVLVGIDNFMGKTSWSRRKYQRVIAWQSLPEPYKGSENNDS